MNSLLSEISAQLVAVSDTPSLDASVLLANIIRKPRTWVLAHPELALTEDQQSQLRESLSRLEAGEPFPYVLGHWEFFGLDFDVTPDVLIPRPETETLVAEALQVLSPADPENLHLLEIGTGSGAISIALAKELPAARITATDLSPKALSVAEENAVQNRVLGQIRFLQGDLFQPVPKGATFDLVVSNPPYIPRGQLSSLMPEVRDYEPRIALDGGKDGLTDC